MTKIYEQVYLAHVDPKQIAKDLPDINYSQHDRTNVGLIHLFQFGQSHMWISKIGARANRD